MREKTVVVFGGTGFVGRHVVRNLAAYGARVKVASRLPESGYFLKPAGMVGQVVPVYCDYSDYDSLAAIIDGADYVVNCTGILYERKKGQFKAVHTDLPESIAAACSVAGVKRFTHISALGIEKSSSRYAKSKLEGEKRVLKAFPDASILRPSVIFGENDDFFNKFAGLSEILPFLPLIGGGETKFQPVYVGDVANAVMKTLLLPSVDKKSPLGKTYELGGPLVVNFKDIYQILYRETGHKNMLVNIPFWAAKIQAFFFGLLPGAPLLTADQVESLKTDAIVSNKAEGLEALGLPVTSMDVVLPRYLTTYRAGGRFAELPSV
jgi:NADH dehydrogenase